MYTFLFRSSINIFKETLFCITKTDKDYFDQVLPLNSKFDQTVEVSNDLCAQHSVSSMLTCAPRFIIICHIL